MKKELRSRMLRYGLAAFLFANSFQSQSQLALTLNPAKSNGFAAWNEDVVSSTLYIYEKVGSTYNLVTQQTTTNKYVRVDPEYFNAPDYYYRIVGTRANSTTVETGYVPAVPVGGTGYMEHEIKVCNGESYAYELVAFETGGSTNIRLKAQDTDNFYDENTLVWIPYFQAVDQTTWNALPFDHPYKTQYFSVNIAPYIEEGNFFDKWNSPVTIGRLVEKRFDQFTHFNSASTRSTADFPYELSPPMTGVGSSWVGFFNSYLDTNTYNGTPDTTVFAPTIAHNLECTLSYSPGDPVVDPGSNWNEWAVAYEASVRDLEDAIGGGGGIVATKDLEDMIHTIFIDTDETVYTTGITFKKYNAEPYINLVRNSTTLDVYSAGSSIPAGLYQVTVFSNTGKILPLYMDFKYAIPFSPLKDYAEILITPNPILSNDLTLRIKNKKTGPVTVKLYDINNNLLHTDSFTMTVKELYKHYDITSYSLPSNQIIVKVSFADGSYLSTIGTE